MGVQSAYVSEAGYTTSRLSADIQKRATGSLTPKDAIISPDAFAGLGIRPQKRITTLRKNQCSAYGSMQTPKMRFSQANCLNLKLRILMLFSSLGIK